MSELSKLPNVGKVLEKNLLEVGIDTPERLRELGVKEAFLRVRAIDPGACLHMLYGICGAAAGVRDTLLSKETKSDLKEFYKTLI